MSAFAEAPDERARMGRISGVLWTVAALVAALGCFLPGAEHAGRGWVLGLSAVVLAYGVGSVSGWIPWDRASMRSLALGMVFTIPVVGVALALTGGAASYIEPLLVGSLLYAAFFFPARWAWPLVVELILCAGTPLLYDDGAIETGYLPRYVALVAAYLAATWVMVALKSRLVDAEMEQRDYANQDPLTGVGNRRKFDATLTQELKQRRSSREARRSEDETPFALLIIDLDDFKGINDTYGHPVGDAVLCRAARSAQSILRSTDTLARIGGDEFAVIAPGAHGEGLEQMAEAICAAVSAADPEDASPTPAASIGWAVYPRDGEDFETLMHSADERMLARKRGRRPLRVVS
jgi:diguanylate cyclase (GGDEF)-like protein